MSATDYLAKKRIAELEAQNAELKKNQLDYEIKAVQAKSSNQIANGAFGSLQLILFRGSVQHNGFSYFELDLEGPGLLCDPNGEFCIVLVNGSPEIKPSGEIVSSDVKIYFQGSEKSCELFMCFHSYNSSFINYL
jgi:hypothetical protein